MHKKDFQVALKIIRFQNVEKVNVPTYFSDKVFMLRVVVFIQTVLDSLTGYFWTEFQNNLSEPTQR